MATMKDVARLAGVSHGTVSNVVNGVKTVNSEIVSRVEAAMKELNYHPDAKARSLRSSRTHSIGIVLPNITDQLYSALFTAVERFFQPMGFSIFLHLTNDSPGTEQAVLKQLQQQRVEAIILITCIPGSTELFDDLIANDIRLVFVQRKPHDMYLRTFTGIDYCQCIYDLTCHLLRTNNPDIRLLTGNKDFSCEQDAILGFKKAFAEHNLACDDAYIRSAQNDKENAFRITTWWLQGGSAPSIIITTTDEHAKGALAAVEMFHPDPFTTLVVSFADSSWATSRTTPNIRIFQQDFTFLGETAARQACELVIHNIPPSGSAALLPPAPLQPSESYAPAGILMKSAEPLRMALLDGASAYAARLLLPSFIKQTNINVEAEVLSYPEMQEYMSGHFDDGSYDLLQTNIAWFHSLAHEHHFYELSGLADNIVENFDAGILNLYGFSDNRLFGMPYMLDTQILFYRKDLFEDIHNQRLFYEQYKTDLQVPASWHEYVRIAAFFTQSANPRSPVPYGTAMGGSRFFSVYGFMPLLWEAGARLFAPDGTPLLPNNGAVFALKQYADLFSYAHPESFKWGWAEQTIQFVQGDVAMMPLYQAHYMDFLSKETIITDNKLGVSPLPGKRSILGGWNLTIPRTCKCPERAAAFLSWLSNADNSIAYNILGGSIPTVAALSSGELQKAYPWFLCAYENIRNAGPMLDEGNPVSQILFENIMSEYIQQAITGKIPAEEAYRGMAVAFANVRSGQS